MNAEQKLAKIAKLVPIGVYLHITVSVGSVRSGIKWINKYDYYIITTNNVHEVNIANNYHTHSSANLNYYYDVICNGLFEFNNPHRNIARAGDVI